VPWREHGILREAVEGVTDFLDWREVLKRSGKTRQARLEAFGVELPPEVDDHSFDMIYERSGVLPPCKRKPGESLRRVFLCR